MKRENINKITDSLWFNTGDNINMNGNKIWNSSKKYSPKISFINLNPNIDIDHEKDIIVQSQQFITNSTEMF